MPLERPLSLQLILHNYNQIKSTERIIWMSKTLTIFFFHFTFFFSSSLPARCIIFFFSFCSFRAGPFLLLLPVCSCFFFLLISIPAFFSVPLRWCQVVMLKTVVYGNQVRFESLKNSAGTSTKSDNVVYSSADSCRNIHIYILDTYRRNDNRRKNKGRRKEDAGETFLEKYSPLTLLQGFERVVQSLHVRGYGRPNINIIFWPPRSGVAFPTTSGL